MTTNATVQYLDGDDMVLTDADGSTADVFDIDLAEGENVFKIKVTAEDTTTTVTYNIRIRRAETDDLVSNLGQTTGGALNVPGGAGGYAAQFTTGSEPGGYKISKVRLKIHADSGTTPMVSIYSDSAGKPDESLKALTNPAAIPTTATEVDFDAGDYRLDAGTPYWVAVELASGTGQVRVSATLSTSEDAGFAAGWSIGDNASELGGVTWATQMGFTVIPQIAIKGAPVTVPGAPASLTATPGDTEVDLLWTPPASDGARPSPSTSTGSATMAETPGARTGRTCRRLRHRLRPGRRADGDGDGPGERDPAHLPGAGGEQCGGRRRGRGHGDADRGAGRAGVADRHSGQHPGCPDLDGASLGRGAAITKYQYRVSVDGGSNWAPDWTDVPDGSDTGTDQADERSLTITSLTNGTLHTFQVRAVNSEGNGDLREATATPAAGPSAPDAPASLTATPGDAQATLTWTAPTFDGNSAITKYQYRVSVDDGTTWNPDWADVPDGPDAGSDLADERALTLKGLEAVILHTFEVRAVNSEGDGGAAQTTATPTAIITLAADFTSIVRDLHEVTFTLTRAGSTAQAADVILMVENATGDSVITASGQTETLTFQVGDDTVEFAVPLFWIRSGRPTGSFVATVEAPAEYDASAATATVEVVNPTGTLINVSLDKTSYQVTEGDDLTFNVVFNIEQEIAPPNKDFTDIASAIAVSGTAAVIDDFKLSSFALSVPANSWSLVSNRYVATIPTMVETVEDALYERPMGAHEGFEIDLQAAGGTPPWVTLQGPTSGTTRYPVTIQDNETLNLNAELSSTGLTSGANLRINEDAGEDVTLTVTNTGLASDGNR